MGASELRKSFANYEILATLGEGGMGEVYLAEDIELSRKVAIKFISDDGENNQTLVKRFQNEARILASLSHPNIVSVYNFGKHGNSHYIVMEYIDGQPLSQIIKSRGFGISEALDVMEKIASAMVESHKNGVLHRDLKPSNIIIDQNGVPKLVDFGISKSLLNDNSQLTKADSFIGTLQYLAPEILYGKSPSPQSDIFSLGVVFYEMIVGVNPFLAENKFQVIEKIKNSNIDIPDTISSILPEGIEDLIHGMIQPSKVKRLKSMDEIVQHIKSIDRSGIPEALLVSRRPEVMILNENRIRLRLLGKGYQTREIGIIISLAARYQENFSGEASDKTLALDESSKVSISDEALSYALNQFKEVKSQLYEGNRKFGRYLIKRIKRQYCQFENSHYKNYIQLFLTSLILTAGGFLIFLNFDNHKEIAATPAQLTTLPLGTSYKTKKVMFIEETGEVDFDGVFKVDILNTENKRYEMILNDDASGEIWNVETSINPLVQPFSFKRSNGFSYKTILTGDYDAIFPLEIGKSMTYSYTSVVRFKDQKKPTRTDEIQCNVKGAGNTETSMGAYFTYEVFCQSTQEPDKYRETFFISPKLGMPLRSDRIQKMVRKGKLVTVVQTFEVFSVKFPELTAGKQ